MTTQRPEMNVTARRPLKSELQQIMALLESANFAHIGGLEMPEFPLSDCFIALQANQVVGVCGYKILDERTAKCTLTAVLPAYRKNGVATRLKQVCVDYLRERGITTLYSNNDDESVINWNIREFGFRRTGKVVPKVENFGRPDVDHWINLVASLTPPARSITPEQVDEYQVKGYLLLRGRFGNKEVEAWSEESDRLWQLPGLADKESFRVQGRDLINGGRVLERVDWVLPQSPVFTNLAHDDRILVPLCQLFEEEPVLFKDKLIVRPPGAYGYGLHQDQPYWEDAGLPHGGILTVSVAIDDIDERNSMLSLFPGYHHQCLKSPPGNPFDTDLTAVDLNMEESMTMKRGDMLIFNALVPHRSGPNVASENRRMLFLSYAAARCGKDIYERYYRLKAGQA